MKVDDFLSEARYQLIEQTWFEDTTLQQLMNALKKVIKVYLKGLPWRSMVQAGRYLEDFTVAYIVALHSAAEQETGIPIAIDPEYCTCDSCDRNIHVPYNEASDELKMLHSYGVLDSGRGVQRVYDDADWQHG